MGSDPELWFLAHRWIGPAHKNNLPMSWCEVQTHQFAAGLLREVQHLLMRTMEIQLLEGYWQH
jgi:hypothetical protein